MTKKLLLVALVLLMQGCSWKNIFFQDTPFDTMTIVNYKGKIRNYRGYYKRDNLFKFKNKTYFHTYYNLKNHSLHILLLKHSGYYLYNISSVNTKVMYLDGKKVSYYSIKKKLKKKGFYYLRNPLKKGYKLTHSFKKYQDVKTIQFELSDYSTILPKYKKAIKSYNFYSIKHTSLVPKEMVYDTYIRYKKLAKSVKQKNTILEIGYKLGFENKKKKNNVINKQVKKDTQKKIQKNKVIPQKEEKDVSINHNEAIKIIEKETCSEPKKNNNILEKTNYNYYLRKASLDELNQYINKISLHSYEKNLSPFQLQQLTARQTYLKEEALLKHGTLETLIQAYKRNKDPRYKSRILVLMKKNTGN